MSRLREVHQKLIDGVGACSVPMWSCGCPAGFCNEPAYGKPTADGQARYDGYVPALACYDHGGPRLKDVSHLGDSCRFCGTAHDAVEKYPCPAFTKEKP